MAKRTDKKEDKKSKKVHKEEKKHAYFGKDKKDKGKDVKDKTKVKDDGTDKSKQKDKEKSKTPKTDKHKRKKMKKSARTRAAKSGLFFPVGRIHRLLKAEVPRKVRVGATSSVYVAAIMEYIISEVLELAAKDAFSKKKQRITPRHLQLAIRKDAELSMFFKSTISQGGVVPHDQRNVTNPADRALRARA